MILEKVAKHLFLLVLLLPQFIFPFPKKVDAWAWIGFNYDQYVPLNIVGTAQFKGVLDENLLRKALDIMQEWHPSLACSAYYDKDLRSWILQKSDAPIPLQLTVRTSDTQWQTIMSDELDTMLPTATGPFARVHYCKGADRGELIVTMHHSLSDGMSRTYFMFELFKLVDDLKNNRAIEPIIDHFLDIHYCDLYRDLNVDDFIQRSVNMHPKDVSGYKVFFIPFCFSKEETEKIKNKYRSCGSSLQTILSAVVAKAVAINRGKRGDHNSFKIFCHNPVNIRLNFKCAPLTGHDFGDWVSGVNTEHMIDENVDIIQLSKEIKQQLYAGIEDKKHLYFLKNIDQFITTTDFSSEQIFATAQVNHPTATVSQLGTLDFAANYGDVTIERLYGLFNWRGCFVHEDTFIMTGAIFQGQLMGMFACIEPVVSRETAREMADCARTLLIN